MSITLPREHVAPCELFASCDDPGLRALGVWSGRQCVVMLSFEQDGDEWLVLADEKGIHEPFESPALYWEERA